MNKDILEKIKKIFSKDKRIVAGYIFGSIAKGDFHDKSDIDLAVMLNPQKVKDFSLDDQLDLEVDISLALETENYDLVVLNRAPLILQFRIISTGKLIYVYNDEIRCELEEKIMDNYYDFYIRLKQFNKEYFQALEEKYIK
jgi:predicted nucleotidyltransferase